MLSSLREFFPNQDFCQRTLESLPWNPSTLQKIPKHVLGYWPGLLDLSLTLTECSLEYAQPSKATQQKEKSDNVRQDELQKV